MRPEDRCPGALRLHAAADGLLARVRLPGGALSAAQMHTLAELAREHGSGVLELTSRGNIQIRGLRAADPAGTILTAAGLLPSPTHERVRNILSSPLSGLIGGFADVRSWVRNLDAALCADAAMTELSGRFLLAVDDGRGDVAGLDTDIAAMVYDESSVALLIAGADTGVRMPPEAVVSTIMAAVHAFLAVRTDEWRVRELPRAGHEITEHLALTPDPQHMPVAISSRPLPPIGWFAQDDGQVTLGAGLKLGRLDARLAEFIAAIERPLTVTPWRTLVISDLDDWRAEQVVRVLAPMGLIFDAESPWIETTACTGSPGCNKSHTDVQKDAADAIESGTSPAEGRQHWAGCERGCGTPPGDTTVVVATPDGYHIKSRDR
ncbi:precorrin-3B synthase [Hoyosella sp. YIM 151337]|uniref:precorrin-3B synthase n=1 Tax=Hoyosella sp. YIM 151337 TaxID=2992742 RepID=UPI00223591C4|nr:precorrin-3B synthase [Hoyosella sp. YIM 151337]MCW4353044.1 precorrin-3B synthase [Hoyosella sp. YIM 151337]